MNIINRTIQLTEAINALPAPTKAALMQGWAPFQEAGIERAVLRDDCWPHVVEPTPEFVRFCAERGVEA